MRLWSRLGVLALVLGASLPARGAGVLQSRLTDIDARVDRLEQQVQDLSLDYGQRRGLIGAVEARVRFEEAVYQFLIGQYEPAALSFFTLVDAQALSAQPLHQDSEWYLAECLFELGNLATAADAYERVVLEGPNHPFFADAVRRLLEVYGLLRDNERFYDVYQRYIVTGKVQATDFVKYTVAKSLWRQGEVARARAMFSEVAAESTSYIRARYFLGAVLAGQGQYPEAIAEFRRVVEATPQGDPSDAEVTELAWLAIGRLSYESGDYVTAADAYQKVPRDSKYYADQLYEQVWTYVKQERWNEALDYLDIFLLGYPTHREAVNLELTRAHVLMKEGRRDEALTSYESVVEDYTPVQEQLGRLKYNRQDPARYFRMLADPDAAQELEGQPLPDFAVEILTDDELMGRAVDVYRSMDNQQVDLELSEALVEQVSEVLRRADRNIGTFARGRAAVRGVRDDALTMQAALVGYEIDYLLSRGSSLDRAALEDLSSRLSVIQGRSDEVEAEASGDTGRLQALDAQVQAVQTVAGRVLAQAQDQADQARALQALLAENPGGLSASALSDARRELDTLLQELQRAQLGLERVTSDGTRSSLVAMMSSSESDPASRTRNLLARDYAALRAEVGRLRAGATGSDAGQLFSRLDDLWARTSTLDGQAARILGQLDAAEQSEIAVLRRRLAEESDRVATSRADLAGVQSGAGEIATEIAQVSFGRLEDEIGGTIEEADVGIIDVYWLEKTEVSDEIERLGKESATTMQALDDRFRIVRQKMDAQTEASAGGEK